MYDLPYRAPIQERLARSLERAGNGDEALRRHAELLTLWGDADPALQARVAASRRAVARLESPG